MKTVKLFSLSLLLSLAGLAYAAGAQSAAQTTAAKPSCCGAGASCCADGAACCKADKHHAGCCADGVCKMRVKSAEHHGQEAAAHAAHAGSQHADQQKAHAHNVSTDACSTEGCCCAGHDKAEGQQAAAAHGDCCKMHGDKAHAAHATTTAGEKAHASCCAMRMTGASGGQDAKSCCAPGAACCTANAKAGKQ